MLNNNPWQFHFSLNFQGHSYKILGDTCDEDIIHYSSFNQYYNEEELFRSDFDVKFFHDKNILNGLNGEMATYSNNNIP